MEFDPYALRAAVALVMILLGAFALKQRGQQESMTSQMATLVARQYACGYPTNGQPATLVQEWCFSNEMRKLHGQPPWTFVPYLTNLAMHGEPGNAPPWALASWVAETYPGKSLGAFIAWYTGQNGVAPGQAPYGVNPAALAQIEAALPPGAKEAGTRAYAAAVAWAKTHPQSG